MRKAWIGMEWALLIVVVAGAASGCSRNPADTSMADVAAEQGAGKPAAGAASNTPARALLAYEHEIGVELSADRIASRVQQVQAACNAARFGECVVLGVQQQGGEMPRAELSMRAEPRAVEPLIQAAGAEGEVGSRNTHAEDLAVAVSDNDLLQDRLRKQHARLLEFQARQDLKVTDIIALSQQLAETESQLDAATREGAQQRRRIDTQLLTIRFEPPGSQAGGSEIGKALRDSTGIAAQAVALLIRLLSGVLPVALLALIVMLMLRGWRRKKTAWVARNA